MSSGATILTRLKKRYIRIRIIEIVLLSFFIAAFTWSCAAALHASIAVQFLLPITLGFIAFLFRFFQLDLNKVNEKSIAAFINATYYEFNSSADLVLKNEEELTVLAKIQRLKTNHSLELGSSKILFPHNIKAFTILAMLGMAVVTLVYLGQFRFQTSKTISSGNNQTLASSEVKKVSAQLAETKISVAPPVYTRVAKYTTENLNLTIQENSVVTWILQFSDSVKKVGIVMSSQDTLKFSRSNNSWKLTETLDRNGFYQLVWKDDETHASDFYRINIIKDQTPVIKLTSLNQFTQISFDSKQVIEANPVITDDYGLTDAYIIATVSKGSGESVKFREEKIRFSVPAQVNGNHVSAKRAFDLKNLGLEPGDELYFYVEALDNKSPVANKARTETYFISLQDTAKDVMIAEGGLGVDLMPEYFRSQRQIIIDTEKLIREKKSIARKEFNSKSNELGYDQKVLRLRYGQFLGEEAESGINPAGNHSEDHDEHEPGKAEDLIKEFGHQHDKDNEHNLVEEKNPAKRSVDPEKKEDPFAEFVHQHDNEESATFFFQSLKLKLKAALTQMWDAELYLRLYEPEKSLPYQYRALKLLKEISSDSRIYVHRTGFEPPPIKEEKRLSADLNEIFNAFQSYDALIKINFPKISEALKLTEKLLAQKTVSLTSAEKNILLQSGNELAKAALENPVLLEGLTALSTLTNNNSVNISKKLKVLRRSYWAALPKQPSKSGKQNTTLHTLDEQFIRQLELQQ